MKTAERASGLRVERQACRPRLAEGYECQSEQAGSKQEERSGLGSGNFVDLEVIGINAAVWVDDSNHQICEYVTGSGVNPGILDSGRASFSVAGFADFSVLSEFHGGPVIAGNVVKRLLALTSGVHSQVDTYELEEVVATVGDVERVGSMSPR